MLYSGIFEAVRIRQSGFPMRLLHVGLPMHRWSNCETYLKMRDLSRTKDHFEGTNGNFTLGKAMLFFRICWCHCFNSTPEAEFLERYGRLMPKEQWPQLVGPRQIAMLHYASAASILIRHFGLPENRVASNLIVDHYQFPWVFIAIWGWFSHQTHPIARQVSPPEKVELLVSAGIPSWCHVQLLSLDLGTSLVISWYEHIYIYR